jgi:capsular exopolysaccharide synthesis family protein
VEESEMDFTIKEIIAVLLKRLVFITVCVFAGLCISFIISRYIMKPSYTATVQMYVNPMESTSSANLNELNYAQKVVTTYINFLQTKVFYKQVMEESNLAYSQGQLKQMTDIHSINNSEIFEISVTSNNPEDSFLLVEAMQNIAPRIIKSIRATAEISIVDPVVLPTAPSSPNVRMNTLIGGLVAVISAIMVSMLWEIFDVNVKNQEDLIQRYQLPILGEIPSFNIEDERKINKFKFLKPIIRKKNVRKIVNCINKNTKFIITEAYNALRTNLRFTLLGDSCKKIMISSPVPDDGKSTTSANLAITIAQTGAKVLLMDCDLRKGKLHSFFNVKSVQGVSNTLTGMIDEKNAIHNTIYENVELMTMGAVAPNPAELLASVQMEELLKKLEKLYDYIIIDTPPVNVVSDALSMVKLVDGIVIVVKENNTSHPDLLNAINKYNFVKGNILGLVINGVTIKNNGKYKSKYYYNYGNTHD